MDFLADHPGSTLSELALHLAAPPSAIFRICQEMMALGYLDRDEHAKGYQLTARFLSIGQRVAASTSVVAAAANALRSLRDDLPHTVSIGKRLGDRGVVLECFPARENFRYVLEPGAEFHFHTSAPGKILMAFLPPYERQRLLRRLDLVRFNDRTITTIEALSQELDRVRHRGWSQDLAEKIDGCHCLGAGVFDHRGEVVAAIWLSSPAARLPEADFSGTVGRLLAASAEITRRLGGIVPPPA